MKYFNNCNQDNQFYPTPNTLVNKMLDGIDFRFINTILEPSAGTGNIVEGIAKIENRICHHLDVDCIEINPDLRVLLKDKFSKSREEEIERKIRAINDLRTWDSNTRQRTELPEEKVKEREVLQNRLDKFLYDGIHIVNDDFLTYQTFKHYDLIIMNPPFNNGCKHLLKALKMQSRGGSVVCILNAETIKNPCNATRQELVALLEKYNASIEFIPDAFVDAERKTNVEIALIKVYVEPIKEEDEDSDIFLHFKKAMEIEDTPYEVNDIEVTNLFQMMVTRYNLEVRCGLELISQYKKLKPLIMSTMNADKYDKPLLELVGVNSNNDYVNKTRMKYWKALLSNEKFVGKLTSELRKKYQNKISELVNYDFNEFNIQKLSAEMNSHIRSGIENAILEMFDKLTEEHSWFADSQSNRHYYNEWATNKAHKIGKKVILPCYGVFDSWDGSPRVYNAIDTLSDIEKILNYLDGGMTIEVNLANTLSYYFDRKITKNIPLKYFDVTFYKKGTVHITFNCPRLIERFNIYVGGKKDWLPPCYGHKRYDKMTQEEKDVILSFQGKKAYDEVCDVSGYYLAPVVNDNMLMLPENM